MTIFTAAPRVTSAIVALFFAAVAISAAVPLVPVA
jgi:hypothetical protein